MSFWLIVLLVVFVCSALLFFLRLRQTEPESYLHRSYVLVFLSAGFETTFGDMLENILRTEWAAQAKVFRRYQDRPAALYTYLERGLSPVVVVQMELLRVKPESSSAATHSVSAQYHFYLHTGEEIGSYSSPRGELTEAAARVALERLNQALGRWQERYPERSLRASLQHTK